MAELVAGMFISLDGVAQAPGPGEDFQKSGWSMPFYSKELGEWNVQFNRENGGLLFGHVTYQAFRQAFEASGDSHPSAAIVNRARKFVVSNTLDQADWVNSELIHGDVMAEIRRLKAENERDIHLRGSIRLVQSLLSAGLIDRLELMVFPVVLGLGRRLFADGYGAELKLLASRPFSSGVVLLRYEVK